MGDRIINEHDESDPDADEELYLVVRGRAMFELDGDRVAAPMGTFVFVPPGVKRAAFAEEPETTLIALGGTPGKAYEPDGWEIWAPLNPLYQAGKYAEAADRGRGSPAVRGLLYNLADAVDHLARAIERSEPSHAWAQDDSDFDPIRDEPAFKELIERKGLPFALWPGGQRIARRFLHRAKDAPRRRRHAPRHEARDRDRAARQGQ